MTDDIVHEGNALTIERPGALQAPRNGRVRTAAANARRPRGVGRVYQPTYRDKKRGELRRVETWWVQYSHRGKTYREPSHSTVRADAVKLLKRRLGEIGRGKLVGPREEKITFTDLATGLVQEYRLQGRRSLGALVGRIEPDGRLDLNRVGGRLRHLADFFGSDLALDITGDRI